MGRAWAWPSRTPFRGPSRIADGLRPRHQAGACRPAMSRLEKPSSSAMRRGHVGLVRRGRLQAVRQARLRVHADVRLHPEVPLVALPRLAHLRIPLPRLVPGRARRVDDARVHDRPALQAVAQRSQVRVDLREQRRDRAGRRIAEKCTGIKAGLSGRAVTTRKRP